VLKGKLIHPDIMAALALCGHGDKVLIADGNYPLDARSGSAEKVCLGLTPGLPTVTDVLAAVQSAVEIEKAEVMEPGDGSKEPAPSAFLPLRAACWECCEKQVDYCGPSG